MENLLWFYRRKFGVDAYALAQQVGITPQRLSRIERNQEEATDIIKDTCSRVLGVPIETLFPPEDLEFKKLQAPIKESIIERIEKTLGEVMFCERHLTSLEINRWLFWADEVLELIIKSKISLDKKIGDWLIEKMKDKLKKEEQDIEDKKEKVLNG